MKTLLIEYLLQTASGTLIHLGFFYRTGKSDSDDQFPIFCKTFDYPSGATKYIVNLVLSDGGKLLVLEPEGILVTLAEPDLEDGFIFGRKETIKFLGYEFIEAA